MKQDTQFRAAPGRVLCRIREDVTEEDGFELPEAKINLIAEVVDIGIGLTLEDSAIIGLLKPGSLLVLPKLKGQMYQDLIAVKLQDINIICDEQR